MKVNCCLNRYLPGKTVRNEMSVLKKERRTSRFRTISLLALCLVVSPMLKAQELKVLGDNNYPPLLYLNKQQNPDGFDSEIIKIVAKEAGLNVKLELMDWDVATKQVLDSKADILLGMNRIPQREKQWVFTESYLENKTVIFVKNDNFYITRIEDLFNRNVGVQRSDLAEEFLSSRFPQIVLYKYPNQLEALRALQNGKLDAVIGNYYVGLYLLQKHKMKEDIKIQGRPVLRTPYCIALKKGNTKLLPRLNSAIRSLKKKGEIARLQDEWFGKDYFIGEYFAIYKILDWIIYIALFVIGVVAISWGFVYTLKRKVSKATTDLEETNQYYRVLIENASDIIIVVKKDGTMSYFSPSLTKILGYLPEELKDKTIYDLIFPGDLQFATALFSGRLQRLHSLSEIRMMGKDGGSRILEVLANNLLDEHAVNGIVINARDITERVSAEKEIKMLAQTIRNISECVVITDMRNNILFVNEAFCKTYGYSREEILGQSITILHSAGQNYREIYHATLRGGWQGEVMNRRKDEGEMPVLLSTAVVYDNKNIPIALVSVLIDITERKSVEAELIRARDEAEKSNRLKSEFLAQMSHEIRTPINAILSFTSLLRDEFESKVSEDLRSSFTIIDNGGRRLIRTIDMILNMSEIQAGNFEVNLRELDVCRDVLENLMIEFQNPAHSKHLELIIEKKTGESKIIGDAYTVTQIFQNLIDNAIKYTHKGCVKISIYNTDRHELCVDVTDTGIGISNEYFPHLFEPFSQEETGYTRRFEGNGLGLSLVKKYVALNNAAITVKSEKGKGSTFTVIFNI